MKIKGLFYILLSLLLMNACKQDSSKTETQSQVGKKGNFPQKANMILLTDRPPQLETPLKVFRQDITPNESFFVRWHLSVLPSAIDLDTFRLKITGEVNKTLSLSMKDLKSKFTPYTIVALAECAGNSRSLFKPRVPGSQWCHGAMGNAKWTGVKVKDILDMAGIKSTAVDISFDGLDRGPLPNTPDFVKSLDVKHAMDGEVMIAYQMNGEDIPMLNGFPLKLVVPGWLATYWVGSLHKIEVLPHKFEGFWMKKAYLAPDNDKAKEHPDSLSKKMVPLTTIALHSIFVEPDTDQTVTHGKPFEVEGLAFERGTGIKKVEISLDGGTNWQETILDPEIAKYSWRRWRYKWTPAKSGQYNLKVRATSNAGETQVEDQWNRSGYSRIVIEELKVNVE